MGQYYMVAFRHKGEPVILNARKVEGEGYIGAKLMEHSWMLNPLMMAVAAEMYKWPMRLLWCGDYAEDDEVRDATLGALGSNPWNMEEEPNHAFAKIDFDYSGKWLCNHSKKLAVDLDDYRRKADKDGWVICPFSLLTALGNGRGGGDYHDTHVNYDEVGTWAWDLISIEDEKPGGYETYGVVFKED